MEKRSTSSNVTLSREPARRDLTSRECAKILCGLLNGLAGILHEEDMEALRKAFGGDSDRWSWNTSAAVRVAMRSVGSLIGALRLMTVEDPSQLDIAMQWIHETDDLWKKLKKL